MDKEKTMSRPSRWIVGLSAAALFLGGASVLVAKDARAPGDPSRTEERSAASSRASGTAGDMAIANCRTVDEARRNAEAVRVALGISEAQKRIWENFLLAQVTASVALEKMEQAFGRMKEATSPLARLQARLEALELHSNAVRTIQDPLASLYGSLDADQKKKADALLADIPCRM
jgi:hypothetical protein